jgi:hypothetical protein
MKTAILALLCFGVFYLSFPDAAQAQNTYSIKGTVADTTSKVKLANTSISILNASDSILVKYGRAGADGSFTINNLPQGKFILLVAYPDYADFKGQFVLDATNPTHDFGPISLTLKAKLLEEIVINGTAAISIKGDTTVFSTSNLKIQPNSNVEDLLKQLPGISVDENGKITAQGQAINKVLVDGEEFFGDDPTLVTKNIRGDMVKSVQLFDKKSDQATFTGIDDGVKTKTLNIQLKDGSKDGYFGKLDGGQTPTQYYQGQGMFNRFKAKQKFSAYGTLANTGKTGLSLDDAGKLGTSSLQASDDGGLYFTGSSDELESFSGRYNGRGIPLAKSGGVHYDSKWNKDKEILNTNYKIGSLDVDGSQNTLNQSDQPSGVINSNSTQDYKNYMFRQKLDATYEVKLDSTSTLKLAADGTLKNSTADNNYLTLRARGDNSALNRSLRTLSNDADQKVFNASLFWTKKFKKKGRTFSLNVSEALNKNVTKGFLNSVNDFYNTAGKIDSTQHIDQYKTSDGTSAVLNTNMTWSEPFTKTFSVVLNYGVILRNDNAEKLSFNKSTTGKYDLLDQQYSNNFDLHQVSNVGGVVFNYNKNKTVINFGTRVTGVNLTQTDLISHKEYKRNYISFTPQARYSYRFSQQKSLDFSLYGYTQQPSINQIQPIKVNDDPLNIALGNPDLKPSFIGQPSVYYYSYKVLTGTSINLQAYGGFTSNPIISSRFTDAVGKTTSQSVNLTGKMPYNYSFYGSMSKKLKKSGLTIGLNVSTGYSQFYSYINNLINTTQTLNYSGGVSFSNSKVKKYNFRVSVNPRYTETQVSINSKLNDNNWSLSSSGSFTIFLPGKVEIGSDARYTYTQKTQSFNTSINPIIWNSSISKKFFKKENLKFSLSGSDLLNQNVGFSRQPYTQSSYTTIQRYFMGSITWDFTKMGGAAAQK